MKWSYKWYVVLLVAVGQRNRHEASQFLFSGIIVISNFRQKVNIRRVTDDIFKCTFSYDVCCNLRNKSWKHNKPALVRYWFGANQGIIRINGRLIHKQIYASIGLESLVNIAYFGGLSHRQITSVSLVSSSNIKKWVPNIDDSCASFPIPCYAKRKCEQLWQILLGKPKYRYVHSAEALLLTWSLLWDLCYAP